MALLRAAHRRARSGARRNIPQCLAPAGGEALLRHLAWRRRQDGMGGREQATRTRGNTAVGEHRAFAHPFIF